MGDCFWQGGLILVAKIGPGDHYFAKIGLVGPLLGGTDFGVTDHPRKTCRFFNSKCNHCKKIGHIARVCGSKAVVVTQQQQSDESAVVPISQTIKQCHVDIPPMFQILHLPQMQKRLCLMVDSASPIKFINAKTWQDLEKPKLQATD